MIRRTILTVLLLVFCGAAAAQKYPERRAIRSGNRQYEKGAYPEAETAYRRALEKTPDSPEATFNLSDALYKQERYDEAGKLAASAAQQLAADPSRREEAAQAFFNQGNALFKQRKLQEALEAYKNSLKLNPGDMEAKFNYAYTKKLLDRDQNNQNDQNNQTNQNNQNDQNNQNNQDNRDNQNNQNDRKNDNDRNNRNDDPNRDPNKDPNRNPDGDGDRNDPSDKPRPDSGEQPQDGGMSREEAERLLDAVQGSEDKTKEKVDAKKAKVVGRSGKNW